MLERRIMLKQSQEQQRQESDGPKQPSLTHDKYALDLNIGIRVRDPSQMFMFRDTKWVRGSSNPPLTHFRFPNQSRDSAGAFTKHISQHAEISFIGSQTSGSVDRNSADLGSAAVPEASNLIKSGNHPQPWLYNKSSNFPAPNSSCNAFVLLHKVDKEHAYSVSINQVPKSESHDAFAPSYLNKPSQSPKCDNNRLSDRNYLNSHLVSVKKKEDGQTRSTRPAMIQSDARVDQNPSVTESCEIPSISYAAASRIRNTSPAHLQRLDVAKPEEGSLKSTKRKFLAFERLPWHEKVTEASSSSVELEGEHSVVRQSKKMKVLAGDAHSRLELTTQLMQRLFQPPPATVLSQDTVNHCDTVAYYASKLALRGACSLCVEARRNMTCKSRRFQDLSKTIQGFVDRSKRVENAVSRLEKNSSWIGEVRMDFEGLEAFAIVDRVAEFHLRRPVVRRRDTSKPKHDPQRYVKACPAPKTVPEGQNCVSL